MATVPPEKCVYLSPAELRPYLSGLLSKERVQEINAHLLICDACNERLNRDNQPPPPIEFVGAVDHPVETVTLPELGTTSPASYPSIPGYEILVEIAQGGMGVVYKALQVDIKRVVAIKMIRAGGHVHPEKLARFRIEAEAAARMQHPHIVAIFGSGELQGSPYFSMEFVDGGSLAAKLAGTPVSADHAAKLVEVLARAVQYAHEQGIVHRDLKPANILLVKKDGTAKIADFGMARQIEATEHMTATGQIIGTPSYMAPEQALGKTEKVGPLCDVYSLGAILYECLTGRPPFKGVTSLDTIEMVKSLEPAPPRTLLATVPLDLEIICLKCLQKEPGQRYQSAKELADDLHRFLEGQPIEARPPSPLRRALRAITSKPLFDSRFGSWDVLLFWLAGTVGISHFMVFLFRMCGLPPWHGWIPHGIGIIFLFYLLFPRLWKATTDDEKRLVWIIYFNYAACGVADIIVLQVNGWPSPFWLFDEVILYPIWALINGICFFFIGMTYSPWFHGFLVAFVVVAIVMALFPDYAPLAYSIAWTITIVFFGFHFRGMRIDEAATRL